MLESDNGGGGTVSPMDGSVVGQVQSDGSAVMADVVVVHPAEAAPPLGDAKADVPLIDAGCALGASTGRCDAGAEISTAGLYLWLSADVGVQIAGGLVTAWNDRSGSGRNATQTVAQYRPTLMANWHGGKPALHFDGENRFLFFAAGFDDFSKGLTVFLVSETLVDNSCPSFMSFSNGGELDDLSVHRQPNDAWEYEVADQSFASQAGDQRIGHTSQVTLVHHTDSRVDLYSDGALSGETMIDMPQVVTRARNELGRSSYNGCEFLNGNIAEIVLYARALQDSERISVEAYLRSKWGL